MELDPSAPATFRQLARERLPQDTFEFLDGSAGDGTAADGNLAAFARRRLVPRLLTDVSTIDLGVEVLGTRLSAPLGIAPLPRLAGVGDEGERALAQAAAATGMLYCAPTNATYTLEDLSIDGAARWFQLYVHGDDAITAQLVRRAAAAGYQAIVVTVDRPVDMPSRPHPPSPVDTDGTPGAYPNLAPYGGEEVIRHRHRPDFDLPALERLCADSELPVVAKGVLRPDDARRAVSAGCRAIWVSNHGGRLLHRVVAPLEVLPGIAEAVAGCAEIHLDGGVRTASDVAMALAMGAQCVHLGRTLAYALAIGGQAGAARFLGSLATELAAVCAALGARSIAELEPSHVTLAEPG